MINVQTDGRRYDPEHMRFSRKAGVWFYLKVIPDGSASNSALNRIDDFTNRCFNKECIICYYKSKRDRYKKNINYKTKCNKIILESFNSGIAYSPYKL